MADRAAVVESALQPSGEEGRIEHFDVLIVGAGLSGIGAAYHLQSECPKKSFLILEGRNAMGGTWDLFRYPGVRSDSDMYTLGYRFRPWTQAQAIADGGHGVMAAADQAHAQAVRRHLLDALPDDVRGFLYSAPGVPTSRDGSTSDGEH